MLGLAAHARDLTPSEQKVITDDTTKNFKDPSSAQFRWTPIKDSAVEFDSQFYCGQVNAKNSYGAYVGFTPFLTMLFTKNGKVVVAGLVGVGSPGDSEEAATIQMCTKYGLNPADAR